jgi:hypothetical protein
MADRFFRFIGRMFPFLKRPPSIAAIALAIVVVGAGYVIGKYGVVEPLENFTKYLDDSLTSFDASNVARTFYSELTGCELTGFDETGFAAVCKPAGDQMLEDLRCTRTGECEPETGFLGSVFLATRNTVAALWSGSTWLGVVIYAAALAISGVWLAGRIKPEGEPFLWLVWLLLVPAVASLAALGLSWLLALFSAVLSQALAGVAWVIATFGGAIALFKAGMQVFSTAHRIETVGADVPGKSASSRDTSDAPER